MVAQAMVPPTGMMDAQHPMSRTFSSDTSVDRRRGVPLEAVACDMLVKVRRNRVSRSPRSFRFAAQRDARKPIANAAETQL